VRIRILFFDGCPHLAATEARVKAVVASLTSDADLQLVRIESADDARRHRFLGSPTVQIDGVDIEPDARSRTDFVLGCRLYGSAGIPPAAMIAAAIREAVT
jgi:hypothetical protein